MAHASKNKRRRSSPPPPMQRDSRQNLITGRLDLHRDGYGFVRPAGGDRENDLFIPPNELNGAMQGDEVLVEEAPPGRDGRRSGRIARVMTRSNPTVVGIFHYARPHRRQEEFLLRGNYVTPLDERMGQPIFIPDGDELPKLTATQDRTLGEEATAQQHDWFAPERGSQPLEGLAVDIEITAFPTPGRPARGRILEILGPPDAFGIDVEIIIRKHHLPHIFPQKVLHEADVEALKDPAAEASVGPFDSDQDATNLGAPSMAAVSSSQWVGGAPATSRRDFRDLPIVTIDGETAKDFDDAVLVRPLPNGNTELQVHIADVSHYVRPETALDLEARLRGTSVYFPDRAVPMLPPALSSGLCSLRPDEDRLVLSCIMQVDPRGEVLGYEICEGILRSAARLTYTVVQAVLDGNNPAEVQNYEHHDWASLTPRIHQMHELALTLNVKRRRRGSIDFDLPEPVVQFDSAGNMSGIVRSQRGWSHRLIEEFMLSANECVAHWLEAQGIPSLYRVHETPDPKRIVDFEDTAANFGYTLGLGNLPVKKFTMKSDRREQRSRGDRGHHNDRKPQQHQVPDSIPVTPQMYQRLTAKIAGKPEERILAYLMLRSLKQARYSEQNFGHFALASPSYTHFTSPIRRYPDLIIHRLLRAMLQSGADPHGQPILSTEPQPWGAHAPSPSTGHSGHDKRSSNRDPIAFEEIANVATETSQSERRADDAERELIEWKKIKFMQDRVGDDFNAIILAVTKYGFFVELDELFIEGLVPLSSLENQLNQRQGFGGGGRGRGSRDSYGDQSRFTYRDTDRVILNTRTGQSFRMGQRVHVLLDRIDRQQRRLQFALIPEVTYAPPKGFTQSKKSPKKDRERNKKDKGKRKKNSRK